jgi:phage tail sheath protein FI
MRPGTQIKQLATLPPKSVPSNTSTWFVAGLAERGALQPIEINSMAAYLKVLGQRTGFTMLYDAVDTFFREGGSSVVVSRVLGGAAVTAFKNLLDGAAGTSLIVKANSPGAWGNNLQVAVLAGGVGGTYKLQITYNAVIVETSPDLLDTAAGVAWSTTSSYVTITQGASVLDPAVAAAAALATGADDTAGINDATWAAALAKFTKGLGPGYVSQPGRTISQAHLDTLAHAFNNNRVALLDAPDSAVVATLTAAAVAARAGGNGKYGGMFAPWMVVPGIAQGTTRTVPPSALVAGVSARNEGSISPNAPNAGVNGIARYVIGTSQAEFIDADRDTLNDAGVNLIRVMLSSTRVYGWRSLADSATDAQWINLGNARLFTAIAADADAVAEQFVLNQIDGQGLIQSQFGGELAAMLLTYYDQGALYGATPDEAFSVDVGDQVNTPTTIALGELHAVLAVRMSPMSEQVIIEIVKVAITEGV